MINAVWLAMIVTGVAFSLTGGADAAHAVTAAAIDGAESAVVFSFGLIGILAFWSGMMNIVQEAGIADFIATRLAPLIRRLFPSIPAGHPAHASIVMSVVANLLGIGQAATPLSLQAMEYLQSLNGGRTVASDSMCTFVILCTSGLTIIPGTVIAIRTAAGSTMPAAIVGTTIVATTASTITAIVLDRVMRRRTHR